MEGRGGNGAQGGSPRTSNISFSGVSEWFKDLGSTLTMQPRREGGPAASDAGLRNGRGGRPAPLRIDSTAQVAPALATSMLTQNRQVSAEAGGARRRRRRPAACYEGARSGSRP